MVIEVFSFRHALLLGVLALVVSGAAMDDAAAENKGEAASLPTIPYGAVYYRKTNPPPEDWARDYDQAASDGMNTFRHWFMWSAIEVAPGEYRWDDYDRQMELAAKHGITTIVADILSAAPEWAFQEYPHARVERKDGTKVHSEYIVATAVGGHPGLCLDNEDVRARADAFLRAPGQAVPEPPRLGRLQHVQRAEPLWRRGGMLLRGLSPAACPACRDSRPWPSGATS